MPKHTPGPWTVSPLHTEEVWAPAVVYGKRIATCQHWPQHDSEANARLIAAAPDLLDLLNEAMPYVEEGETFNKPTRRDLSRRIRAAIQTVEGGAA